jgi:hypothetical protein
MSDFECYVGFKPCGCAIACVVIEPEHPKDTARAVKQFIEHGYRVEGKSVEWARQNLSRCRCGADR